MISTFLCLLTPMTLGASVAYAADASGAAGHDLVIYGGTSAGIVAGIQAL
ncbi:MAG: hypothetical protein ACJA2W_001308, partial [Planctomycetota bacterium]